MACPNTGLAWQKLQRDLPFQCRFVQKEHDRMAVEVSAQKAVGHGREIPYLISCELRVQLLVRFQRADAKLPAQVVDDGAADRSRRGRSSCARSSSAC